MQPNIWLLQSCSPIVQGLKICSMHLIRVLIPAARIAMYVIPAATTYRVFFILFPYVIHLKVNQKLFCSSCSPIVLGHRVCSMHLISEHVIPTSPNHKVCDTRSTNCKVSHVVSICYFFLAGPDNMLCWVSQTIPTIEQNPKIWGQHMHLFITYEMHQPSGVPNPYQMLWASALQIVR